jgi:hypothetical protein
MSFIEDKLEQAVIDFFKAEAFESTGIFHE